MIKSFSLKFIIALLFLAGTIEYFKIGKSLINSTITKSFINVSPFSIGAGDIDSVSADILHAKNLILKNSLKTFSLGKSFDSDPYLHQRIVEFAYPAKLTESNFFIDSINSKLNASCKLVDKYMNVGLYDCK